MVRKYYYYVSGICWMVSLFACIISLAAFVELGSGIYMVSLGISAVVFVTTGIWLYKSLKKIRGEK